MRDSRERLARRASGGDLTAAKRLVDLLEGRVSPADQLDGLIASLSEPLQVWVVLVEDRHENSIMLFVHEPDACAHAARTIRNLLDSVYEPDDADQVRAMTDKEVIYAWSNDGADSRARCYVSVFRQPIRPGA